MASKSDLTGTRVPAKQGVPPWTSGSTAIAELCDITVLLYPGSDGTGSCAKHALAHRVKPNGASNNVRIRSETFVTHRYRLEETGAGGEAAFGGSREGESRIVKHRGR